MNRHNCNFDIDRDFDESLKAVLLSMESAAAVRMGNAIRKSFYLGHRVTLQDVLSIPRTKWLKTEQLGKLTLDKFYACVQCGV